METHRSHELPRVYLSSEHFTGHRFEVFIARLFVRKDHLTRCPNRMFSFTEHW